MKTGDVLRRSAAAACLAMAGLMVVLQFVLTPASAAPTPLFLLFTGLWVFGAAMLAVAPVFGALGTAAWGVIAAASAWRMHGGSPENVTVIVGSAMAAGLALAFLVTRRRT